jgi:PAS domain-containing protein
MAPGKGQYQLIMSARRHALRLRNQRDVHQALTFLPAPAFVFEMETGKILACNAHLASLLGYAEGELLELNIERIQPSGHVAGCHDARTQVPPQGLLAWRYCRKDGAQLDVRVHYRELEYLADTAQMTKARFVVVEFWQEAP